MTTAAAAFHQIIIMFFIILVGAFCYAVKLIDQEMNRRLSDLVLLLVNPLVIFSSYQREFEASLLSGLLISFLLAVITHVLSILLSHVFIRGKKHQEDVALERFALVYSNCGFIGIPLVNGVFHSEGVFYLTAYMTVFNLIVWTHGMLTMSGKRNIKSIIQSVISPAVLATVFGFLFFVCRIMLPDDLKQTVNYIGNMNTPMAMLVSGVTIAQTDFLKLIKKVKIYYIAAVRLLLIPIIMLFLFRFFPMPRMVLMTSILACACPTAVSINLFAIRYHKNYLYASEIFGVTTVFSLITIPVVMILSNFLVS